MAECARPEPGTGDRLLVPQLAPQHPDRKTREPFASVIRGEVRSPLAGGEHALVEMGMATHAGTTTEVFEKLVSNWLAAAKHPTTGRQFTEMVYQPMLEVLAYLRANGFRTFIRQSSVGRLDKGLDKAWAKGWTVEDMKRDWKRFFPEHQP